MFCDQAVLQFSKKYSTHVMIIIMAVEVDGSTFCAELIYCFAKTFDKICMCQNKCNTNPMEKIDLSQRNLLREKSLSTPIKWFWATCTSFRNVDFFFSLLKQRYIQARNTVCKKKYTKSARKVSKKQIKPILKLK